MLETGTVLKQIQLNPEFYQLKISSPAITSVARAGQFLMLSTWDGYDPFLKRPFCFYQIDPDQGAFEILYKKVGKGTKLISRASQGDQVQLYGPLGNGFTLPPGASKIAVVARGVGIAPLYALLQESSQRGIKVYTFYSARSAEYLLETAGVEKLSEEVFYMTDDASRGPAGNVTVFLEELLKDMELDAVYVCGSKRLTRHVKRLEEIYSFSGFVSLEERMACGNGSCKGCVIETAAGKQRICKEGPVFPVRVVNL